MILIFTVVDLSVRGETMVKTNAKPDRATANDGLCCASVVDAPLAQEEAEDLARVLGALADPVRLRLFSLVASQIEICSCELERPLARSQPTISHHTKVLADAGLLIGERRGRWMWWRVDPDRLAAVRKALGA
jgi:ArsR family transcriptional regulator